MDFIVLGDSNGALDSVCVAIHKVAQLHLHLISSYHHLIMKSRRQHICIFISVCQFILHCAVLFKVYWFIMLISQRKQFFWLRAVYSTAISWPMSGSSPLPPPAWIFTALAAAALPINCSHCCSSLPLTEWGSWSQQRLALREHPEMTGQRLGVVRPCSIQGMCPSGSAKVPGSPGTVVLCYLFFFHQSKSLECSRKGIRKVWNQTGGYKFYHLGIWVLSMCSHMLGAPEHAQCNSGKW